MSIKKICFACNEDGFGPSAFAYYVVRAVVEMWRASHDKDKLEIWILNASAYAFNKALYVDFPEVHLARVNSLIQLEKVHGEVHVEQTLKRLSQYAGYRTEYSHLTAHSDDAHFGTGVAYP
jgi:hypothetical protein